MKPARSRDQYLQKTYGLTLAQYNQMLKMGKGRCWICLKRNTKAGKPRILHVEHDHQTDRVRGLACFPCNFRLIRRLRDAARLRRLADYLESTFDGRSLTPGAATPEFLRTSPGGRVLVPGADVPSFLGPSLSTTTRTARSKRSA